MIDGLESRMWIEHHERFSACAARLLGRFKRRPSRDPMPMIGRAIAFAIAASLASLTLGSSLA
jgi:hypothetical protein